MVAQRLLHASEVDVMGDDGVPVFHSPEFVTRVFDEELAKILSSLPADAAPVSIDRYTEARRISESMIATGAHDPI